MKNQTKWLIGVVIVVVFGAGVYLGTNTDLFKGNLRGGEKGGLLTVSKARCEMFSKDSKKLIKGNLQYITACKEKYPSLWFTTREQQIAGAKCEKLNGNPYLAFNEESGNDQVFCKFGSEGGCTQNELNGGTCFKEK